MEGAASIIQRSSSTFPNQPGTLEEIFDEKLKVFTSLDYRDLTNPIDHYHNHIIKQRLPQRAGSRERSSPTLLLTRGRSSPTVNYNNSISNQYSISTNYGRIKPDPWVSNHSYDYDGAEGCISGNAFRINNSSTLITRPGTPSMGACESSVSPKRLGSPVLKSKVLANRDKESLMDEIIGLKKALLDQTANLQRQKVISTNLETENRKLEKELEEMELQGNSKGAGSRLRSKVQGLKTRVSQLEATCEAQQEELMTLRRDIRVTRTQEIEAERDVFAEEIERLQNFVRRLKALQNRLFCENKQLWRYKDRTAQLEAATQRLEGSSNDLQKSLEKANREIHETTKRGNDNFIKAKRAERQCQDLQEQVCLLTKTVEKERSEKLKLQQMIHVLQDEVQTLEASLSTNRCQAQRLVGSDHHHHHEDHQQSGSLANTWGFLHNSTFHPPKTKDELQDEVDCEKMIIGERPKTRGEQRAKLVNSGDLREGRKSKAKSRAKPMGRKQGVEPNKSQPPIGFTQYHASNAPVLKNQRREDERVGDKTKANTAPLDAVEAAKISPKEPAKVITTMNSCEAEGGNVLMSRSAPSTTEVVEEFHESKLVDDAVAGKEEVEVVEEREGITGGGGAHDDEEDGAEEAPPMHEEAAHQKGPHVLVPRLNLTGSRVLVPTCCISHVQEEQTNSEESALHTSPSNSITTTTNHNNNLNALEAHDEHLSHQKVIAWNDNIGGHDGHQGGAKIEDSIL